ncbi:MAG: ABC transporter substrate-binding protein [Pseudomonas sp.]
MPTLDRRTLLKGTVLASALAGLSACGVSGTGSSGSKVTSLVETIAATPNGLAFDGPTPGGYEGFSFVALTGAGLIRNPYVQDKSDPNVLTQDLYKWEGVLADRYEVSPDGLVYTFHLKQGVKSSKGNELTADDVIWSYERKWNSTSIDPAISYPALTDPAKQLKKIDKYTISFTLEKRGHGFPFLALISKVSGEIYDSTFLKTKATKSDPYAVSWCNKNGYSGFGPYILENYQEGVSLTYTANPNYVLGEPPIKSITQKVSASAATRASLIKTGSVQVSTQLLPADVKSMSGVAGVKTYAPATNNYSWIFMQTQTAPFDNVKVRQAFFKAVPYEQIINNVYHGRARVAKGFLNRSAPNDITEGILDQVYDPEGSLEILRKAGISTPVSFTVICSSSVPDMREMAVQMQSYGKPAGFDVNIKVVPPATWAALVGAKNFQMYITRDMVISYESQPYTLTLIYPVGGPSAPGNLCSWGPDEFYDAINRGVDAGDSLSDEAAKYWHEAELIWQEGRSFIQVCNVDPLMVTSTAVTGFVHRSDNVLDESIFKSA